MKKSKRPGEAISKDAPPPNPLLGDLDPAYIAWFRRTQSEEDRRERYGARAHNMSAAQREAVGL